MNLPFQSNRELKRANLRYVSEEQDGIKRQGKHPHFFYVTSRGKRIRDPRTLKRIQSLAIPPAYRDVWISADPRGHLQAIGKDDRNRKQYRYHPDWNELRNRNKFEKVIAFAEALPGIRLKTAKDLKLDGLPRRKILATVVRLLERTRIRIGNENYTRENHSYGLTTLRDRHVKIRGSGIHFEFRGKSGVHRSVDLNDRRLAKIIKACHELPGHELFQFLDADGARHKIRSEEVNAYLHEISGQEFTAKDFRTWAGTVFAATTLCEFAEFESAKQYKQNLNLAIERAAQILGNTKAVCRKSYIHPHIFEGYQDGTLLKAISKIGVVSTNGSELSALERAVIRFLKKRRQSKAGVADLLQQSLKHLKKKKLAA
jgi:DNA topoisomerase-1